MRVLITGGTGFIGSRLALRCLATGHTVKVVGQQNTAAEAANSKDLVAQGVDVMLASVTDRDCMDSAVQGVDVVYHLAAAQHEANVPDQHFWDVNVTGTRNLLDASAQAGVKRFVHGSTIGVYGGALTGIIDEESPLAPDNIYGRTKREGEQLVLSYQDRLPVVVVRIPETYGPGDYRLLKLFRAIHKRLFFMIGSGRNLHHLIYIDDLIAGLALAATAAQAPGEGLRTRRQRGTFHERYGGHHCRAARHAHPRLAGAAGAFHDGRHGVRKESASAGRATAAPSPTHGFLQKERGALPPKSLPGPGIYAKGWLPRGRPGHRSLVSEHGIPGVIPAPPVVRGGEVCVS